MHIIEVCVCVCARVCSHRPVRALVCILFLFLFGVKHKDPCIHSIPEKPGMLNIQDFLSNEKDEKTCLPYRKLRT